VFLFFFNFLSDSNIYQQQHKQQQQQQNNGRKGTESLFEE
jgi:hypothetical protein